MQRAPLGNFLKRQRRAAGLTQKRLAAQIGYHSSRISRIESGEELPKPDYLKQFIRVLNIAEPDAQEIWALYEQAQQEKTRRSLTGAPQTPGALTPPAEGSDALPGRHLPPHLYFELREHEQYLAQVTELVLRPHPTRVLCLCGVGGIGKTTLALEAATRLLEEGLFTDALWVSLRNAPSVPGQTNPENGSSLEIEQLLDLFALQMGLEDVARQSFAQKRETIANHFWAHRYLILLDNLEVSGNAVELVQQLTAILGNSRLLVTMRDKRLSQLDLVWMIPIEGLSRRDSANFLQREAVRMGQRIGKPTLLRLQHLYGITRGVPYTLKRVLSQTQQWGVETALRIFQTAESTQITDLYAYMFAREWKALDDSARRLWIFLGRTMPAPISLAELAGLRIIPGEFDAALKELIERGLVESTPKQNQAPARLSLHPMAQEFIRRILVQEALSPELALYHETGCIAEAARAWLAALSRDSSFLQGSARENVTSCIRECDRLGWADRVKAFWEVVSTPLYEFGYWNDYETLEHIALGSVRALGERAIEAEILSELAWIAMERGELEPAEDLAQAALEIFDSLNNCRGIVIAHRYLATIKIEREDFEGARDALRQVLELISRYQTSADPDLAQALRRQEITTRDSLGIVLTELGEYDKAERELEFGYAYALERGPSARAISLYNLGMHWLKRGDPVRAAAFLEDCFQFSRAHNFHKTSADALFQLAAIARERTTLFKARELATQARRRYHQIGASMAEKKVIEFLASIS